MLTLIQLAPQITALCEHEYVFVGKVFSCNGENDGQQGGFFTNVWQTILANFLQLSPTWVNLLNIPSSSLVFMYLPPP
jgi:hypothetical protein